MVACVEGMLTLRARAAAAATTGQYNKQRGESEHPASASSTTYAP